MTQAISNTSPLLYLYRCGGLDWLAQLFEAVATVGAVRAELDQGRAKGYAAPDLANYPWIRLTEPRALPSEWLALDLGAGELATIALALENPSSVVLLDDALARRVAQAAGLQVWGTLRVMLEAKQRGLIAQVAPVIERLQRSGMWISEDIRARILTLASETER